MTGYDKIKKFVSEVHEINCALTDEIIEFIDEIILQEQVGNVPEAEASAERISSVVRSNATTGWIKISERLPEEGIYVIAFEPHCVNNPDKGIGICEVDSDFTAKKSDGSFWITHWMPLPDAPEV